MGYYSTFRITADGNPLDDTMSESLNKISEGEWEYVQGNGEAKWYSLQDDIKALSRQFPAVHFLAERTGEESPDVQRYYAKGGLLKTTKPQLVWPDPPTWWEIAATRVLSC